MPLTRRVAAGFIAAVWIGFGATADAAHVYPDRPIRVIVGFGVIRACLEGFKIGREITRQSGAMGKSDIVRWVRAHT